MISFSCIPQTVGKTEKLEDSPFFTRFSLLLCHISPLAYERLRHNANVVKHGLCIAKLIQNKEFPEIFISEHYTQQRLAENCFSSGRGLLVTPHARFFFLPSRFRSLELKQMGEVIMNDTSQASTQQTEQTSTATITKSKSDDFSIRRFSFPKKKTTNVRPIHISPNPPSTPSQNSINLTHKVTSTRIPILRPIPYHTPCKNGQYDPQNRFVGGVSLNDRTPERRVSGMFRVWN